METTGSKERIGNEQEERTEATMRNEHVGNSPEETGIYADCARRKSDHNVWLLEMRNKSGRDEDDFIQRSAHMLTYLLEEGDLDAALVVAEEEGMGRATRMLLAAGASYGLAEAIISAVNGDDAAEVGRLLDLASPRGSSHDWKKRGIDIDCVVISAISEGKENVVRLLMERGLGDKNSALVEAASSGNLGVVRLLIAMGADPLHDDEIAIREAVANHHDDVAKHLAGLGCDLWAAIRNARTARCPF